jgi:hypothetical protein
MRALPSYEIVDHSTERPIHLMGVPGRLRGEVSVKNPGDERVFLRPGRLEIGGGAAPRLPATMLHSVAVSMIGILAPGDSEVVKIRASIHPQTPPGQYHATLTLGDYRYPAVLHVAEHLDFDMSPNPLIVENGPGSRTHKRVTFANHGNVPIDIGRIGAVALDDELGICRTVRATLHQASDEAKTFDDWLTAYLRQSNELLKKTGLLWVEGPEDPVKIAPGTTAAVDFTIRIPDGLEANARYAAVAYIYDENLKILVVPAGIERVRRRK